MNQETPITETTQETIAPSEIPPQTIGELLRHKRELRNFSLKVISQQTKVHIGLLDLLEKDNLHKLPSKTYVRGFVKAYAKVINVKESEALELLEKTYIDQQNIAPAKLNSTSPSNKTHTTDEGYRTTPVFSKPDESFENIKSVSISYFKNGVKIGGVLILISIITINVKNFIEKSEFETKAKNNIVVTSLNQRPKPVPKPKPVVVEKTSDEKVAPLEINLIQDKKELTEKTELKVNDLSMKTQALAEKQYLIDSSLSKEKLDEYLPSRFRVHPTKGVENVFINATDGDSWLTYKVDDKEIKKFVLRQGRTVFLRGENIRLFIGNVKTVKVFYNNEPLNLLGKNGVKNLVFPDQLKTKFLNPLFVFEKDGNVLTSDEYALKNGATVPSPTAASNKSTPALAIPPVKN